MLYFIDKIFDLYNESTIYKWKGRVILEFEKMAKNHIK